MVGHEKATLKVAVGMKLDVVLQEDAASIQQSTPASLMAILRNLVVSLFRAHGYPSIVKAIVLLSHDFDRLLPMLGIFPP